LTVIKPGAYVVHENWESDHHGSNAPWSPKLSSHEQLKMSLGETGVEKVTNENHLPVV
jgi:hypothetical protein